VPSVRAIGSPVVGTIAAWPGWPAIADRRPWAVRLTPGPHATPSSLDELLDGPWAVSPTSSRAGIRLAGRSIAATGERLTSWPMTWGAVQLPSGGEPIILLVDAPTVGGYPVIGVVASVDRAVIGQLGPGDACTFALVSHEEARAAEIERRRRLEAIGAQLAASVRRGA
jgi:antagonist of KipI